MNKAAILYANQPAQVVRNIIEQFYNYQASQKRAQTFEIVAYLQGGGNYQIVDNLASIDLRQFAALYHKNVIRNLIMPRENIIGQAQVVSYLMKLNVDINDVYITNRLDDSVFAINHFFSTKYLSYLEFHIADQCNLNCKACEHYSGLVKEPHFPNLEQFTKDIEQLHTFIDDIGVIRILGGEPLLNPQINEYVKLARRLYPKSFIFVVTNALLLQTMPDDFFETLKTQNVGINISFYPPMVSKMEFIQKMLTDKGVKFTVSPLNNQFTCKQTLNKHNRGREIFLNCFQAHCHNLYEGKIAACFLPFTTKYFNSYFNKNLPEDGAIDLYNKNLTTEILKYKLTQPFERCCYCMEPVKVDWSTIKQPSELSDWVNL